jgi:chromosome segregation ATPase
MRMPGMGPGNPGGLMGRGGVGPGMPGMRGFDQLRESDPEMAKLAEADMELERQTQEVSEQFHRAPGGEAREKLKQELTELVDKHFEVRQERRELEIKRLEEQLERLRASLKKRMDDRKVLVQQRIGRLLGDDELGF